MVAQGQEARPYALVIFVSTALTLVFYEAMRGRESPDLALVRRSGGRGHLRAHDGRVSDRRSRNRGRRSNLILVRGRSASTIAGRLTAGAIIVLAGLPLIGQFSAQGLAGVAPPSIDTVRATLEALTGGRTLLVVTGVAVIAAPFVGWSWSRRGRGLEFSVLIAASIAPVLLELFVSLLRPMFIERYLAMAIPGLALLIGAAVEFASTWRPTRGAQRMRASSRPSAVVVAVALAVVAALSLRSVGDVYAAPQEDWRSAVAMVAADAQPGDGVIVYPGYARLPFDYYAGRQPVFGMCRLCSRPSAGGSTCRMTRTGRL